MPKAHFDCGAVCQAALEAAASGAAFGVHVTTNHPAGFRRLMYEHMRKNPAHKLSILQAPGVASKFMLVPTDTYEEFQRAA